MNKSNIVLVGMPGAGKSTVGVVLAKSVGKPFVDTDLLIQQRYGMLLQQIIDKYGIKKFLEMEEKVVTELDVKDHVIATGGSVIYSDSALNRLKRNGIIVYLKLTFNEIEKRIKDFKSRGIAKEKGTTLLDVYNERVPLYEKHADVTIICSNKNIEDIVFEIKENIDTHCK